MVMEQLPLARATDPQTSHDAAASLSNITDLQREIVQVFKLREHFTDEELVGTFYGYASPSGVRTRRKELVDLGLLKDSGERRVLLSGRKGIVWTLA